MNAFSHSVFSHLNWKSAHWAHWFSIPGPQVVEGAPITHVSLSDETESKSFVLFQIFKI
jgi:hypothetical protein